MEKNCKKKDGTEREETEEREETRKKDGTGREREGERANDYKSVKCDSSKRMVLNHPFPCLEMKKG